MEFAQAIGAGKRSVSCQFSSSSRIFKKIISPTVQPVLPYSQKELTDVRVKEVTERAERSRAGYMFKPEMPAVSFK